MKTSNTHPAIPADLRNELIKEQTMQEMREEEGMTRYEAAAKAGLTYVTTISGMPLFHGTPEQIAHFHELLGTPKLI